MSQRADERSSWVSCGPIKNGGAAPAEPRGAVSTEQSRGILPKLAVGLNHAYGHESRNDRRRFDCDVVHQVLCLTHPTCPAHAKHQVALQLSISIDAPAEMMALTRWCVPGPARGFRSEVVVVMAALAGRAEKTKPAASLVIIVNERLESSPCRAVCLARSCAEHVAVYASKTRYPTPGSVLMIVGEVGSRSILARSSPIKTRRYWVSWTCAGPQTVRRI
jgi:hypothetical protein